MITDELTDVIAQLSDLIQALEVRVAALEAALPPPEQRQILRLSSTGPGNNGQVIPGSMILDDEHAREFYATLGPATVLPLTALPPWTHMALARGSWWLLQKG